MILEGSANAAAFEIYVEQLLAPSLQAGHIVVMDHLRAHKGERVRQATRAKGCQVLFATSLFARLLPHRRDLLQVQDELTTNWRQNARSA